jgi:hypothetical protein
MEKTERISWIVRLSVMALSGTFQASIHSPSLHLSGKMTPASRLQASNPVETIHDHTRSLILPFLTLLISSGCKLPYLNFPSYRRGRGMVKANISFSQSNMSRI